MSMARLFLAILVALSLAAAPGPAFAGPVPDCAMVDAGSGMGDHEKMACCTPGCAVICPTAALPTDGFQIPSIDQSSLPAMVPPAAELASADPAAADPPPRSTIS